MNLFKKIITKENVYVATAISIALHPIVELDYLAYDFLGFRLTTIVNILLLPSLAILTFFLFEDNKKRTIIFSAIYALILGAYFLVHVNVLNDILPKLYLTGNFYFSIVDEILYTVTMFTPLVYIWVFNKQNVNENTLKKIVLTLSTTVTLPVVISNIFVFGQSTYGDYTIDNIFSWFSLPFSEYNRPKYYATKFFFEEGNTTGVLLLMILPFLFYFFLREVNKKSKVLIGVEVFLQILAMYMLSTRVASYGTILICVAMLAIYAILILLKYEKVNKVFISFMLLMTVVSSVIYPFCPAYQNQLINAQDYGFLKADDYLKDEADGIFREKEGTLEKYSEEWFGFYTFMFEAYSYMINVTPPVYYTEWYNYRHDPEFWVRLIFDHPLEERVNGRQIQKIFMNYKWNELTETEKMTGMGYGPFMRGSMIIEQDFTRQLYAFGYVGEVLYMGPWVLLTAYLAIKLLFGYKDRKWNYLNIICLMSTCLGFVSSYMSGHVMDELSTSLIIALSMGVLFSRLKRETDE